MSPNKITAFIAKYYIHTISAALIFAVGVWVGQNNQFLLGLANKASLVGHSAKPSVVNLSNQATPAGVNVNFSQFWDVWGKLNSEYLNKNNLDQQKLLNGAISGLVNAAGDPYTMYLDTEQNQAFSADLSGVYEGVGIELGSKDGRLIVISPIDGSPAIEAGVLAGDVISKINGKDTTSMVVPDAVTAIRGKAGTAISFTFERGGKQVDLTIMRAKITVKSVQLVDKGNGVALVRLTRFGDSTQDEWRAMVDKFTLEGYKKMILDLRNDPGGRLDTAIYIANEFVGNGVSVVQEEDSSGNRQQFKTDHEGRLQNITPVILINKGSASASEILAGALRDLKKAILVGETSFGKGTVQKVVDLSAGAGLHITIAKWLTPSGTWVHGKGLKPDFEIILSEADIKAARDLQLDKALELAK